MIPAQIHYKLSCRQAKFPSISSQNDLEGQGQRPPFSIPAESIPGCMFGANLVIPSQICDELSCGQGKVYGRTDRRTGGQTKATTVPLRPERPRGKNRFPGIGIPIIKMRQSSCRVIFKVGMYMQTDMINPPGSPKHNTLGITPR